VEFFAVAQFFLRILYTVQDQQLKKGEFKSGKSVRGSKTLIRVSCEEIAKIIRKKKIENNGI
jgi:hypothetical protein